jgi:glutamine amidotransferase
VIAIINYGLGNLHSVNKAAAHVGGETVVTDEAQEILSADKVILPGVGAFADGMAGLASRGLVTVIQEIAEQGKPLLGICLGMQLLFEVGEEQGIHPGLGLLAGRVVPFSGSGIKIPQIGWNQLEICRESYLMNGIENGDYFYFNHGYCCLPENPQDILTETTYGARFASSVNNESIYGVQFHPEKSQKLGLQIMKNFVELPDG